MSRLPPQKFGRTIGAGNERHLASTPRRSPGQRSSSEELLPGSRSAAIAQQRERDRSARLRAPVEHTPPERRARLMAVLREMRGNDANTQAQRVLRALRGGPASSLELRKYLDVIQVSSRVSELRAAGHAIDTIWIQQPTDAGRLHRVALYRLRN